jgi:betaine reductase
MYYPILKGAAYALIQASDVALHQGSSAARERITNPDSQFLADLPAHWRSFEQAIAYPPNQAFIGNIHPRDLRVVTRPWYVNLIENASAEGKYGAIFSEDMLYALMKAVDVFDLVLLDDIFLVSAKEKLQAYEGIKNWACLSKLEKNQANLHQIEELVNTGVAEPIYFQHKLIGCVKRAHEYDVVLSAHVMFENLVVKATGAVALQLLMNKTGLNPAEVDYLIECSEEACGDMNQRGGGNFAKSLGEICGCINATGSDTRSFCAAPAHAIIEAAALVQSGVYDNVVVLAGGSSAKLGMNSRDHVKKGLPMLEDMLGAFAIHIAKNDGISPIIRTDAIGRHRIGSGASPQAVMQAIVADPLASAGLKISDIDVFSPEMQNPEITEPAGAGNVPAANYKMIAALGVMQKEFERSQINEVVESIGMPGFAPTQGHIPSGVPYLGHCREAILNGTAQRAMIIGKGSLFLGRMTNLFDGISFIIEANKGIEKHESQLTNIRKKTRVGLTVLGSEHPISELVKGAKAASAADPLLEVVLIGSKKTGGMEAVEADTSEDCLKIMDKMLIDGELDAAVTMHYAFPISVSTVGRIITPAYGRKIYIANTTGASATERVVALVRNAIAGIAVAKACGNQEPTVALLNIDGARQAEHILRKLCQNGYKIKFAESNRADGGMLMRGNDLLQGVPDIMVMDSLTGNVITKVFSAFLSGGSYETSGDGYGPGVGEKYGKIVNIISRASGAPVITGALLYACKASRGNLPVVVDAEFAAAKIAGLEDLLPSLKNQTVEEEKVAVPTEKAVNEEITGIEVFVIEDAEKLLWKNGIYALSGMGCTGPVIMVASEDHTKAIEVLKQGGYL